MDPDDDVCLCFHVSLRKIRAFVEREDPPVASLISECLGAGTGCGWCVPYLQKLHADHQRGRTPDLRITPEQYADRRTTYRKTGQRPEDGSDQRPEDGAE
ncbi:MAG: (2Fe-2S)-binding protein [Leptolyngbya sp. PLA3]|nr:MAG: (2Fe-2S)-binding protein [Cyanobacteria bacterium CYA]MCE7968944.1 (2Fe-2S)-binding protein [Leptolyngbya sp. PL-A3]